MFAMWDGHWEIFEALELSLWDATSPHTMDTRPEVAETRALALSQTGLNYSETLEPEVVFRLCVHAVRPPPLRSLCNFSLVHLPPLALASSHQQQPAATHVFLSVSKGGRVASSSTT
jgi:hypothetical protein